MCSGSDISPEPEYVGPRSNNPAPQQRTRPDTRMACTTALNGTACVAQQPNALQTAEEQVLFSLSVLVLLSLLTLLGFIYRWRSTRTMHSASPVFCGLVVLGGTMVGLSNLFQSLPASSSICAATAAFLHIGFTTAFGALFIKTYRLASIFNNVELRAIAMPTTRLMLALGALVSVDVILIISWTASAPFYVSPIDYQTCISTYADEFSWTLIALKAAGTAYGSYLTYQVRNVPSSFNESRHIAFAIITMAVFGGLYIIVVALFGLSTTSLRRVQWAFKCLVVVFTELLLFSPKIYNIVWLADGENILASLARGRHGTILTNLASDPNDKSAEVSATESQPLRRPRGSFSNEELTTMVAQQSRRKSHLAASLESIMDNKMIELHSALEKLRKERDIALSQVKRHQRSLEESLQLTDDLAEQLGAVAGEIDFLKSLGVAEPAAPPPRVTRQGSSVHRKSTIAQMVAAQNEGRDSERNNSSELGSTLVDSPSMMSDSAQSPLSSSNTEKPAMPSLASLPLPALPMPTMPTIGDIGKRPSQRRVASLPPMLELGKIDESASAEAEAAATSSVVSGSTDPAGNASSVVEIAPGAAEAEINLVIHDSELDSSRVPPPLPSRQTAPMMPKRTSLSWTPDSDEFTTSTMPSLARKNLRQQSISIEARMRAESNVSAPELVVEIGEVTIDSARRPSANVSEPPPLPPPPALLPPPSSLIRPDAAVSPTSAEQRSAPPQSMRFARRRSIAADGPLLPPPPPPPADNATNAAWPTIDLRTADQTVVSSPAVHHAPADTAKYVIAPSSARGAGSATLQLLQSLKPNPIMQKSSSASQLPSPANITPPSQ